MLELKIETTECFDESSGEFVNIKGETLSLEHSLISLSKWESKWEKPFLVDDPPKTEEELLDYIRCMTLNKNVDPNVYLGLSNKNMEDINHYIEAPMTATWFNNTGSSISREIITSEIIYYWMITLNIPFECQKWHLNRLLTLIRVCSIKNSPKKKMSKREISSRNRALNQARRSKYNSKG